LNHPMHGDHPAQILRAQGVGQHQTSQHELANTKPWANTQNQHHKLNRKDSTISCTPTQQLAIRPSPAWWL